jgi:predicted DNA-binding transcriptional regulator AlpA
MEHELLTTAEVASALQVTRTAIWSWRRQGHFPEPVDISPPSSKRKTLRWRRSDLLEFISGGQA